MEYAEDFKSLLSQGTFMEQKTFLRSFVKRIDFKPGQVAINYTIPIPMENNVSSEREVLPIEYSGEPPGFRTLNLLIKSVSKSVQSISFSYKSEYLCLLYKTDFIRKSSISQNQYGYARELLVSFFSASIYS
jgi:hypothetical protein